MTLLRIDALDSLKLRRDGLYERFETEFVKRTLRAGATFVDVGAHIGYYTVLAAELVGPEGKVFAFEPDPVNFHLLRANTFAYSGGLVKLYNAAVTNAPGKRDLYRNHENSGDHHLYATPGWRSTSVLAVRLDLVPELEGKSIDFLKVDTQGYEAFVLQGARHLILRSPALVGIIEFSPVHLRMAGSSPEAFLGWLELLAFHVYWRVAPPEAGPAEGELRPAPLAELPKRRRHCNLIVSRKALL